MRARPGLPNAISSMAFWSEEIDGVCEPRELRQSVAHLGL